jgi:hypothetical protein
MREVKLVMTQSTFWLRLRIQFRAMRAYFLGLVAGSSLLPAMFLFLMILTDNDELFGLGRGALFGVALTANLALFVAIGLFVTVARSLAPSPFERLLPRTVTFRVDGLRIEPRDGDAFEDSWAWIISAVDTASGMDLKIGDAPTLILHITPAMIGHAHFEQIRLWLERHEKLPSG